MVLCCLYTVRVAAGQQSELKEQQGHCGDVEDAVGVCVPFVLFMMDFADDQPVCFVVVFINLMLTGFLVCASGL